MKHARESFYDLILRVITRKIAQLRVIQRYITNTKIILSRKEKKFLFSLIKMSFVITIFVFTIKMSLVIIPQLGTAGEVPWPHGPKLHT